MNARPLRLPPTVALLPVALVPLVLLAAGSAAVAQQLPPGFIAEPLGSGWSAPTGLAYIDATRLLVAEKAGLVHLLENDSERSLVLDLSSETLNNGDRGILGIAVDPEFAQNGFLYLLLVADPDQDNDESEQETFSRLVRFTTSFAPDGTLAVDMQSRLDLLGQSWPTGIPSCHLSHAVGTIRFLADGSMVVSHGDGAHYDKTDAGGYDPGCFGPSRFSADQDVGAYRSVYPGSLSGKILRIDPATGLGLPDNPLFDGNPASIPSRVYATGLRNPFRFTLQPGSGPREALFISDVGWNNWEEVDVALGGENFGWPCFEGVFAQGDYRAKDPFAFCPAVDLVHAPPVISWHHTTPGAIGFTGSCASALAFYDGDEYPPLYRGALFFTDYSAGWMRVAFLDENRQVQSILPFSSNLGGPIDLVAEPGTGNLVLISLNRSSPVNRIRYLGANRPPVAVASATPSFGPAPLAVQLAGSQSYDPDQDALTFLWDLDDGTTSTLPDPLVVYPDPQRTYRPVLTVSDPLGNGSSRELIVTPGNTPPEIIAIDQPRPGHLYQVGKKVKLRARVADAEDDAAGIPPAVVWHVDFHHAHHVHPDYALLAGVKAEFVPDVPYDGTWFTVRLEVTDSRGLTVSRQLDIYDRETTPDAHLTAISDAAPRAGHTFEVTGHMILPGGLRGAETSRLVFDLGDGTTRTFDGLSHMEDATVAHAYVRPGAYQVTLTATAGAATSTAAATIDALPPRPAVAVFMPHIAPRYMSWLQMQEIAGALVAAAVADEHEAEVFTFDRQAELQTWMEDYLDDGVRDLLVILDVAPAVAYAGEDDGSLAERWLESGNGILWSGKLPFAEYIDALGQTSTDGAFTVGADEVLDAAVPFICRGAGNQALTAEAWRIPSLGPFHSSRALRYDQLGPEWQVEKIYAEDQDQDADGIVIRHLSGGFYAQFHCEKTDALPRAAVLTEFLESYLLRPRQPGPGPLPLR